MSLIYILKQSLLFKLEKLIFVVSKKKNTMTVEKTLEACLILYPSIFPNKWAVYHHWFAVNGNGYDWEDGQLVSCDHISDTTIKDGINKAFEFYASEKQLFNSPINYSMKALKKAIMMVVNLDDRKEDFTPNRDKIYPLCEYSKLLTMPSDVKQDWKEAAKEFYDSLKEMDLSENDKEYLSKVNF